MSRDLFRARLAAKLHRLEATDAGQAVAAIIRYGLRAPKGKIQ